MDTLMIDSIDLKVEEAVLNTLGGQIFSKAPFYRPDEWSFAKREKRPFFIIGRGIPDDLASELGSVKWDCNNGKNAHLAVVQPPPQRDGSRRNRISR
jgi:hypothetical protein